jgi:uroporphyrinogen decarboxylase
MTSRERVIAALQHERPDRVPLDIGGTESSGMTGIFYNRMREHLGLPPGRTQIIEPYQQVVKIEADMRERLGIDTIPLLIEPLGWKPFALPDGSPCEIPQHWNPTEADDGSLVVADAADNIVARMPAGGLYFEPSYAPLAGIAEIAELDDHVESIVSFDWPSFADETVDDIATRAERLFAETDYAIVFNLQCHLLAAGQMLRGYEQFMIDLLAEKLLAHALLQRLTEAYKHRAAQLLERVGHSVQVVLVNDDLGTQNGPMMSLDCYREMILPYQRELFGFIKQQTDAFLLLHSCGSVAAFIPDLVDAGVDALNPVQVSAAGMDSADLKRLYGDRLTFWGGGCDTQHVLRSGSPAEIEAEVARRVEDFRSGGFVFTQVHNIQPDVPPENVSAMLDALARYGR